MNNRTCFCTVALSLMIVPTVFAATRTEKIRNAKVLVVEQSLAPGESAPLPGDGPSVVVYFDAGTIEVTPPQGLPHREIVTHGQVVFRSPHAITVKNIGTSAIRFVWTEYLGMGVPTRWGKEGLAPDYKLLYEDEYGRVYEIRMAAGKYEPLHIHHDRVVICLSGAELEHETLDGRKETSTLKTGEIAWRPEATHVGHNLGKTDLWAIAIEPK